MSDNNKASLGEMIESIVSDFTTLIRGHIELAKSEVLESFRNGLQSSAFFLITFGLANFAVTLLLVAAGFGLVAAGLPAWAAFLILGLVILLLAVASLWFAIRRFKQIRGPVKTIASLNATTETIRSQFED
ncbi:MAG: phage holin family protein [Actinobacteria bacterium]|nr:phage holin family protein [Actinomycetota bacterium]